MTIGKLFTTSAIVALLAVGAVASGTTAASAHVVCNRNGDCWNTHARYRYPGTLGIRFYSNRYDNEQYRHRHWHDQRTWRDEHHDDDRGYYRDGTWVTF